jgi:hypothetical protein
LDNSVGVDAEELGAGGEGNRADDQQDGQFGFHGD